MIRYAAPVYLKTGGSIAKKHGWDTTKTEAKERIRQVQLVQSMIERYYPEAQASPRGGKDLAIPVIR